LRPFPAVTVWSVVQRQVHTIPPVASWDEARITRFVMQHQQRLAVYLAMIGCPAAQIEDLVQDAFLAMFSSRFEERSRAASAAFLRRIARCLFLKSLRRPRLEVQDLDALDGAWAAFEAGDDGEGCLAALRACLATLQEAGRAVLLLRYEERLGVDEIARRVGLARGGVRSALLRSKARLRACMQRRLGS
jgi:RNA polymerase sigma-70 factor (ECF subfamily)